MCGPNDGSLSAPRESRPIASMRCTASRPSRLAPMQPMRPGGAGRLQLLTLVATFAVAAGQLTCRLGPTRIAGPGPATRLDRTARGARCDSCLKRISACPGRLTLGLLPCSRRAPAVVGCGGRETAFYTGSTCGTVRRRNGGASILIVAIGRVGFASEHRTSGSTGEGPRQSRLMRHPFREGNRVENDPSQMKHPSTKRPV